MAFLNGLLAFIQAAPALYKLWMELKSLWEFSNEKVDSKRRVEKVKDAIKKAKEDKNTGDLDDIFVKGKF